MWVTREAQEVLEVFALVTQRSIGVCEISEASGTRHMVVSGVGGEGV